MLDTPFYCAAGQIKTPTFLFDRLRNAIPASAGSFSRLGAKFPLTP